MVQCSVFVIEGAIKIHSQSELKDKTVCSVFGKGHGQLVCNVSACVL